MKPLVVALCVLGLEALMTWAARDFDRTMLYGAALSTTLAP